MFKFDPKKILQHWEYILIFAVFIFLLIVFYNLFFTPNYYSTKEPVQFDIKRGEAFSSVAERLFEKGIIPNETNFRIAAFIYGAEKKVRAARFHIPNGLSYLDLLDFFISGKCLFERSITVSDGQTIKWLAYKLERDIFTDSSKFVNNAFDTAFISTLGLNLNSLEGYLFAKDYVVYEHSPAEELLTIFYKSLNEFFVDSLEERARQIGFTRHEILTLASIIKGETNLEEEMPVISGVYHNRLRIGMRLQADPTIQYILPKGWRRLLYKDLQIDSPYNTYKYSGLPPGPINNPGAKAILAALYPEDNKYLYFVAYGKGGHKFGKTLKEHNQNVRDFRNRFKRKR